MDQLKTNKLIKDYAASLCDVHCPDARFKDGCDLCEQNYDLLRDFYNEAIYNAAQELRTKQENCGGACSDDLEEMCEDYD